MSDTSDQSNLPAPICAGLINVPKALVPNCLKALDRLIGAAVDVPVAWLAQKKAKIDAQTQSYTLVEAAVANAAATEVGADDVTIQNAVNVLLRSTYRKHVNKEAVAKALVNELREVDSSETTENVAPPSSQDGLEADWLNVFERYAEDASSERMQALWGRVLAGEVRKPGQYSLRTLRFLSEFSQEDALTFSKFCNSVFSDVAPKNLINLQFEGKIRPLIDLESSGLIQRGGIGLQQTLNFNEEGYAGLSEGNFVLVFKGEKNTKLQFPVITLTPLGEELRSLLPSRDIHAAAKNFAEAIKSDQTKAAFFGTGIDGFMKKNEIFWEE